MKSLLLRIVMSVAMFALVAPAFADKHGQEHKPNRGAHGIENRIENQKKRIERQLKKGNLSKEQAESLQKNLDDIKAKEEAAKADGDFTKEERKGIRKALTDSSHTIHQEAHPAASQPSVPQPSASPAQ